MPLILGTVRSSSWVIDLFINTRLICKRYPLFAAIRVRSTVSHSLTILILVDYVALPGLKF